MVIPSTSGSEITNYQGNGTIHSGYKRFELSSAAFFVSGLAILSGYVIVAVMSQKHTEPKNDLKIAIWSVVVVVIAIVAIIIVKVSTNSSTTSNTGSSLAPASLMAKITSLNASTFNAVGKGTASSLPTALPPTSTPLTLGGKPEILYVGAEYCPYCATERWPLVIALSRFGSFSSLGLTTSSSTDAFPSTATFAFHGSTYTSKYIAFTAVEETTNVPDGKGGFTPLDSSTAAQQQLITTYDAPPYVAASSKGSIPFIYFGGQFLITGSTYSPSVLQGKTQDEIASSLSDTSSDISQGAVGAANTITAAICTMTNGQPGSVCNNSMIKNLQNQLGK